jgi:hypothetical protein
LNEKQRTYCQSKAEDETEEENSRLEEQRQPNQKGSSQQRQPNQKEPNPTRAKIHTGELKVSI